MAFHINIDGKEITAYEGQTILAAAAAAGIEIPTLCHDDRVKMYGSCGICVVEAEGSPRLLRSCSTLISDNMIIRTDTPRVRSSRKTALELLLSDHTGDCKAPCQQACPGQTDCQGYVGLVANGEYEEAAKLLKDKLPLPASIGRVCPHPCETACRRKLIEEPIAIADIKTFVADNDLFNFLPFIPECEEDTGKSVAVIGGGPGGLSSAYFLRQKGHAVTVFDQMPKMGGMLRYGIPEYRLPKSVLDAEIANIEAMGATLVNDVKIGRDFSLDYLRRNYDAVIIAIGAWTSSRVNCPGEELGNVIGGIDFLRSVAQNHPISIGRRVAVVGGGNTAMDAVRTAVRLGASEVYNIYRRTKAEMPAEAIEIQEAEEEGVIFKNLTNPIEIIGENGKVSKIRLQKMELGEPDASGRRAPVAIPGAEEILPVDTVILAIGQGTDIIGLEQVKLTKKGTIAADESNYLTNLPGVFAIGDATNKGADIAVAAIGEASRSAIAIDGYLKGGQLCYTEPFIVKREMTPEDFADRARAQRIKMKHRSPAERKRDFGEINFGFTAEDAVKEAKRCLECGCLDYFECKLIRYANKYDTKPEKFAGEKHNRIVDNSHPFIHRNPDKCILCGLCVRACEEVMGVTALGLANRGFDTIVKPAMDRPLAETGCISCGQCVNLCPTGALLEILPVAKHVPVLEEGSHSTCEFCSVGCQNKLKTKGGMLLRSIPDETNNPEALLCVKGRFGFSEANSREAISFPLIRENGELAPADFDSAYVQIVKKMQSLRTSHGEQSVAVAVSDALTNEEIAAIRDFARFGLKTNNIYSFNKARSGLHDVLGEDRSTTTFEEMIRTEVIVLLSREIMKTHPIAGIEIKKAVENGAKLIIVNDRETGLEREWANMTVKSGSDLSVLKMFVKAMIDAGKNQIGNIDELEAYVSDTAVSDEVKAAVSMILTAKKAVFVFAQNELTQGAARLIAAAAVLSGHIYKPRAGIIQLKRNCNSQGLADLGVDGSKNLLMGLRDKTVKGLMIFGEDVPHIDLSGLEFLGVMASEITETAEKADVVLPAAVFGGTSGHMTNTVGKTSVINRVIHNTVDNFAVIQELSSCAGHDIVDNYGDLSTISTKKSPEFILPQRNDLYAERVNTDRKHRNIMLKTE